MRMLLTALLISLSSISMASTADFSSNNDTAIEFVGGNDRGKKKRRHKRVNKRRKRACHKAARRNFAG